MPGQTKPSTEEDLRWRCKVVQKEFMEAPGVAPRCVYSHKDGHPVQMRTWKRRKQYPVCVEPVCVVAQAKYERHVQDTQMAAMMGKYFNRHTIPWEPKPGPFASVLEPALRRGIYQQIRQTTGIMAYIGGVPQPFWEMRMTEGIGGLHMKILSSDSIWGWDSGLDGLPDALLAHGAGEFFFDYAFKQDAAFMQTYREEGMATKAKKQPGQVQEIKCGGVKARVYPDGRVCFEHEKGLEELWIPAEDVGNFIDLAGSVAEHTGARPTQSGKRPSGRSYAGEAVVPGSILPVNPTDPPWFMLPPVGEPSLEPGKGFGLGQAAPYIAGWDPASPSKQQRRNAIEKAISQQQLLQYQQLAQQQAALGLTAGALGTPPPLRGIEPPPSHLPTCKCEDCENERAAQSKYAKPMKEKEFNDFVEMAMKYTGKMVPWPWGKKGKKK